MNDRIRRRWRLYETASGRRPVRQFLDGLTSKDRDQILAAMKEVQIDGLIAARHLTGDIYEVRASADRVIYRVLFAREGGKGQILLALEAFRKSTQKTPKRTINLAERRLADWRRRGKRS